MNKLTISDVIDEKLIEALRLVQCMLEDFRAQNYGHAHDWIRHIDSAMSEYTDTHTDDAYSMLHDLIQSGSSGQPVTVPAGYVLVPVELLSDPRDFANPEIEKYCEMWAGRRDAELPAMRKIISDTDALLAAAPKVK